MNYHRPKTLKIWSSENLVSTTCGLGHLETQSELTDADDISRSRYRVLFYDVSVTTPNSKFFSFLLCAALLFFTEAVSSSSSSSIFFPAYFLLQSSLSLIFFCQKSNLLSHSSFSAKKAKAGLVILLNMNPGDYTAEVTSLSPNATEKDVHDFFAFCGAIEHVEIVRAGEYASTAYVTFKNPHALETAVLLSGATIADQRVCITRWGRYDDEYDVWNQSNWNHGVESGSTHSQGPQFAPSAGEVVSVAQDVVKAMAAKGYVLGKDALSKARAFDESHQVSATAAAKVAELSERIGLADKICAGFEVVKSVDERYHIIDATKFAVSATGRTAASAASGMVNSSYFSKGALWVSGALGRAAQAAADLGSRGVNQ